MESLGSEAGYKELSPGVAVMVAADGNSDGTISTQDKNNTWTYYAAKRGYLRGDFNLDTQVNNIDKNNYWWPNEDEGFNSQVPE